MPKFPFNAAAARSGDDVRARPDERAAGRRSTSTSRARASRRSSKAGTCSTSTTAPAATCWTWSGGTSRSRRTSSTSRRRRTTYPFLRPDVTPEQIKASLTPDRRGLLHAELHGMPTRDEETGEPNGWWMKTACRSSRTTTSRRRSYEFTLYQHAVVSGAAAAGGRAEPADPGQRRTATARPRARPIPASGGDLAKYLYPARDRRGEEDQPERQVATEAWGWLPPPLHHEGEKVQTDWLHDFLMDPTPIRPAVVLRMPNFHMSSDEASKLVNYFAAKSERRVSVRIQRASPRRLPGRARAVASRSCSTTR